MNTLTFVRDKEWIDQAKVYTYEALRFLGIRYQWNSKEHIQIDKDHVIKFIVEAYDPVYVVHCGVRVLKLDSTRKLRMFKGQREDNYDLEIDNLGRILGDFLNLDKYMAREFYNNKPQYRDELLYNIKENKKQYRAYKKEIKDLNEELMKDKYELNRLMEESKE